MADFKILGPSNFVSQRWKNGQGTTTELIKETISGSKDFSWRISMADVTTDGPFSTFENYNRTLLLLKGNGITLEFKSKRTDTLNKLLDSASFAGEDPTYATLHNGSITDFNVITHREYCSAKTHVASDNKNSLLCIEGDVILVYALSELKVEIGIEQVVHLETGHLLHVKNSNIQIRDHQNFCYIGIEIHYKSLLKNDETT
jgi:environmental stress-induced protein Ves